MSIVFNNLFYLTEQTSAFNLRIVAKNNRLFLHPKDFTKMPKPIVIFFWNHKVNMNTLLILVLVVINKLLNLSYR